MLERSHDSERDSKFNLVVEEYGRFLNNAIAKLCPKDLGIQFSDIEQDARLRLWRALESEREIRDLASYIYRIAATATIDAVRRVKARREEQLRLESDDEEGETKIAQLSADPDKSPDLIAGRLQIIKKVEATLASFPGEHRTALGMHLEGMTTQEIAAVLGWNEPKARNVVYRGLKDLRLKLRAEGIEYDFE
jgi:RNA polymerase sigma-70 factor, ECF subfamily